MKQRAYGIDFDEKSMRAAWSTLHICMKNLLLLLAPITPFITDKIWRELYSKESIHKEIFPEPDKNYQLSEFTTNIIEFNSLVWNKKKEQGLSLKNEITMEIPENLTIFEADLRSMHKLQE